MNGHCTKQMGGQDMRADEFMLRWGGRVAAWVRGFAATVCAGDGATKPGRAAARRSAGSRGTDFAFALVLSALGAFAISAPALAVPPGEDLVYENGPKPVIFSGTSHADQGLVCKDCHTGLFKREKGSTPIAFEDHSAGKACFACHNGTKSFASKGNCAKCHGNTPPGMASGVEDAKTAMPVPATASVMTQDIAKGATAAKTESVASASSTTPAATQVAPAVAVPAKQEVIRPLATKVCEDCPDHSGWSGWVEGGIGYQSDDSYHFGRYTGLVDSGGVINGGADIRYRGGDGSYLDVVAVDLGLDSRSATVEGGKAGKYGIAFDFDQIPNFREQDARSPFRDAGGGLLQLPAGWVPGPTTDSMPTLSADLATIPLKTERDRLGVRFSLIPGREWEIKGYFRQEKKSGTQDVGATFGYSQTSILPVNLDYKTDDFGLSLGYRGSRLQYNLAYTGSLFKNEQDATIWQNPFSTGPDSGRMAEAPDNQSHRISANLGYQLSETTRLGAHLAFGRMTQDQAFLPYTINPSLIVPGLPASSLDGQIDTTLAKFSISSRPARGMRWDASYTYSNRDNKTPINNYNYVITDSTLAIDPGTGNPVSRQNLPYSFEQNLLRTKISYLLPRDVELSSGFDYDQMDYTYQQVDKTKDATLWAKLRMRPLESVEGSLKYAYSSRDASSFVPLSQQVPPIGNPVFPNSVNPLMQPFELADRDRSKFGFEVAYVPQDRLSLNLDVEYSKDDYPDMVLGLTQADVLTFTPNLSYTFSPSLSASAYYTYEKLSSDQNGLEWITVPPVSSPWTSSDRNLTQTFGLGVNWKAIPDKLDLGADVVYSEFSGKIRYADSTDLPELSSSLFALGLRGAYLLKDRLTLRGAIWYENYEEDDWAKSASVDLLPTVLSLGIPPQDADTFLIYLSVRYDLN
jgi:MtrB/PioB family decaheme-associated outer membrane protein